MKLLPLEEVAETLSMSRQTIQRMINTAPYPPSAFVAAGEKNYSGCDQNSYNNGFYRKSVKPAKAQKVSEAAQMTWCLQT